LKKKRREFSTSPEVGQLNLSLAFPLAEESNSTPAVLNEEKIKILNAIYT
jgi:hypothetical protein